MFPEKWYVRECPKFLEFTESWDEAHPRQKTNVRGNNKEWFYYTEDIKFPKLWEHDTIPFVGGTEITFEEFLNAHLEKQSSIYYEIY